VCKSLDCVEDEQHFVFDCPAYSHIRSQHLDLLQHCCTIADFIILCEPNACGGFLRECFACRKQILSVWIHWTELLVCWVPVAPQDIKYIDWLIDSQVNSPSSEHRGPNRYGKQNWFCSIAWARGIPGDAQTSVCTIVLSSVTFK